MRQALDVLDDGRAGIDPALERTRGRGDRAGVAGIDEMDRRRLLAGDVRVRRIEQLDRDAQVRALAERPVDGCARGAMGAPDVDRDPVRADRVGRDQRAVDDQVRAKLEQDPILRAERLAFGAVDEHGGGSAVLAGDGSPLATDREARAAAAEQATRLEDRDHVGGTSAARDPPESGEMVGVRLGPLRR